MKIIFNICTNWVFLLHKKIKNIKNSTIFNRFTDFKTLACVAGRGDDIINIFVKINNTGCLLELYGGGGGGQFNQNDR